MKKDKIDKALTLRTGLILLIFLLVGLIAVGFYFAQDYLRIMAIDVSKNVIVSNDNLSDKDTAQLQKTLTEKQAAINKVNNFFYTATNYKTQAIDDITKYATANGLSIKESSDANEPIVSGANKQGLAGVNSKYISVTLNNPIQITSLVKFLKLIETNLPKMQLSGISIKNNSSKPGTVNVDPLVIEVYIK